MWEHSVGLRSGKRGFNPSSEFSQWVDPYPWHLGRVSQDFRGFIHRDWHWHPAWKLLLENNLICCRIYFWATYSYSTARISVILLRIQGADQKYYLTWTADSTVTQISFSVWTSPFFREVGRQQSLPSFKDSSWKGCCETSMTHLCSKGPYLWLTATCEIGQVAADTLGKQTVVT